jgi:hypothetical protein
MPASVAWVTLLGAACGAFGGFIVMTTVCNVIHGVRTIWCVVDGAGTGVPLGAAVGAVIGGRKAPAEGSKRKQKSGDDEQ